MTDHERAREIANRLIDESDADPNQHADTSGDVTYRLVNACIHQVTVGVLAGLAAGRELEREELSKDIAHFDPRCVCDSCNNEIQMMIAKRRERK